MLHLWFIVFAVIDIFMLYIYEYIIITLICYTLAFIVSLISLYHYFIYLLFSLRSHYINGF